jgi:hypothetical protein
MRLRLVESACAACAADCVAAGGRRGRSSIIDVALDVPGRREILWLRAGEVERAWLEVAGHRARMVQALCVILADGFADWTEAPEGHVGLYAPDGGRS